MQKSCAEAKPDEIHVKQETSTRIPLVQLAEQRGECAFSVHITIRLLYLHPNKTTVFHELRDKHCEARVNFAN